MLALMADVKDLMVHHKWSNLATWAPHLSYQINYHCHSCISDSNELYEYVGMWLRTMTEGRMKGKAFGIQLQFLV